jgi:hypothetical protein
MMVIISTTITRIFTTNTAGAINQSGVASANGAQIRNTKRTSENFLPILVERVLFPLLRSVSMSLMLLINSTAVAKQPAIQPPRTAKGFSSLV